MRSGNTKKVSPMQMIFQNKIAFYNLVLMLFTWSGACLVYNLIQFYIKYMPGSIFVNYAISACAAFINLFQGKVTEKLGSAKTLTFGFTLTALATMGLNMFSAETEHVYVYAFVLLLAKSGVCLAFGCLYCIHTELFAPETLQTSFAFCNVFARTLNLFGPIVAELPNKSIPMMAILGLSIIAAAASAMIKKKKD